MTASVRALEAGDWPQVQQIYLEGIATGLATFQTSAPTWQQWDAGHLALCRLVLERPGEILAWAALSPISTRPVYRGVAEVSIYVQRGSHGKGYGSTLLHALVQESEAEGIWTLQAGIFPENRPSLALHVKCGFRTVGKRERLGCLAGEWRDVLLLERRSPLVGTASGDC